MDANKQQAVETMWTFLTMYGQRANIPALKSAVQKLITMATQKTAGQPKYAKGSDINVAENLDGVMMEICVEATALVLSGELDSEDRGSEDGGQSSRLENE